MTEAEKHELEGAIAIVADFYNATGFSRMAGVLERLHRLLEGAEGGYDKTAYDLTVAQVIQVLGTWDQDEPLRIGIMPNEAYIHNESRLAPGVLNPEPQHLSLLLSGNNRLTLR